MINYNYETNFLLDNEIAYTEWIESVIESENKELNEINYIFCDDEYLLEINKQYLDHDYYTDVISFDYTEEGLIAGDIFISIDRVKENASNLGISFEEELKRVVIHGVLHYCGYKDKNPIEEEIMRSKEDEKIKMFHVKHN
ncbi:MULTISPECIES: rRNA maturation RNase YbeY [Flavobacterium]|uniref:Endoribonuclease YbeY n=2 Tax=Flavobacterium TaxID=237 RepID=A0AA94JNE6_9FLAO|nr:MULTISPECIES: rRNA maturation RNase YbeY [Flavobacterium]OXA81587.1 rRNA maturation RNase YbeY [Flavobacterium columnare] [Flavobacterium columnare NBRC 100251 = ATCC 23463]AMA50526.1 rRNA maturation factor [Flavobacterium covae]AND63952.1 rRNA maturation factor [Flavobacterium covae]MCH4829460.1 rRNA maturation RNase YbeY [Flavobacterium columnare]MCH4831545.1 rRNA maturation RNase YbeY [Flavobacterium columnare]